MKESDILIVDCDGSNISPSQPRRKRKSTAGERKIGHLWSDDDIYKLIPSVELHRGLWDIASPEYKLTKLDGWRSVAEELGIDGVDANEAKLKWSSLRTTFMVNLSKLRKKKSGQGANESHAVTWKFFQAMMFIERNNVERSTSSTSTLPLESVAVNMSLLGEFSTPSPPSEFAAGTRKRSRPRTTSSLPSTRDSSPTSREISLLNSAIGALHKADANSTFCENLLEELKALPEAAARTLRFKLSRIMMDFVESSQVVTLEHELF